MQSHASALCQKTRSGAQHSTSICAVDLRFPSADPVEASGAKDVCDGELHARERWLRDHVHQHAIDVAHASRVLDLSASKYGDGPLDLVVHCAGVRGLVSDAPLRLPGDVARAEALAVMDAEAVRRTLEINALGTFVVLSRAVPALRLAAGSSSSRQPKVVVMGSPMGPVADNRSGAVMRIGRRRRL